ncbi:MAG: NusA-like transcription termination signal-binding factor [Candidatus Thermoplasmatota archaeon]
MTEITITQDTLGAIALFERITRTTVVDCIDSEDKIVFIVRQGEVKTAVGKDGDNVLRLFKRFNKNIQIVEFSHDPAEFVRNVFYGYKVQKVEIEQRNNIIHATVTVDPKEKAKAIGKAGKNLRLMRNIINRHHNIQSVSVA